MHGFSDHINAYYTLFPTLADRNIQVYAFDQRGWGRSVQKVSQRGLTGPTSVVLDDIACILRRVLDIAQEQALPLFLMGHSMGGAEVLTFAARGPLDVRSRLRGYVAESPYLALHPDSQPSRFTVAAGKLVSKIAPRKKLGKPENFRTL